MTTPENEFSERPHSRLVTTSRGHTIATYDYGGSGPTIVFAHAASFHGQIWNKVIQELEPGFRCISFDFAGHGNSSGSLGRPAEPSHSWSGLFSDIPELLAALGLQRPLLGVGHSLGGAGLISAQLSDSTLFSAIWTYGPIIFEQDPRFASICEAMANIAEQRRPTFPDRSEAKKNFSSRPPFDDVDDGVLDDYLEHGFADNSNGIELRCSPQTEAETYRNGANQLLYQKVDQLVTEIFFGFGSNDPEAGIQSAKLTSLVPKARSGSFEGLGHLGPLENPAEIASSISTFFSSFARR